MAAEVESAREAPRACSTAPASLATNERRKALKNTPSGHAQLLRHGTDHTGLNLARYQRCWRARPLR